MSYGAQQPKLSNHHKKIEKNLKKCNNKNQHIALKSSKTLLKNNKNKNNLLYKIKAIEGESLRRKKKLNILDNVLRIK